MFVPNFLVVFVSKALLQSIPALSETKITVDKIKDLPPKEFSTATIGVVTVNETLQLHHVEVTVTIHHRRRGTLTLTRTLTLTLTLTLILALTLTLTRTLS